ncbi:C-C motif chemokine 8-like [Mastomys coucha]|uniref:C-C motif chemokine 8-like n=1 Tax=Mastomys coucha TaxID=35658 RepID=UPI0012613C2E|nr:C-C motif chemokine 8-like [Mastomys coucha]
MKIYAVILCLLLVAVTVSPEELAGSDKTPVSCCYSLIKLKIPLRVLQSYKRSNNIQCPREAVIFQTKRGKLICADPTQKWVNEYMVILDQKSQALQP